MLRPFLHIAQLFCVALVVAACGTAALARPAAVASTQASLAMRYDIGTPTLQDVWVDPQFGDDGRDGSSRNNALRTLSEAWQRIPQGVALASGYRVLLTSGTYSEAMLPNYLEARYGSQQFPIIIQAADGPGTARLGGDLNIFDVRYLYLIDLTIVPDPPGDALHCERCDHLLVRRSTLSGGERQAHETVKINQSQYVYLEDSDIAGADDNAIDFVSVQYGHVVGNRVHNSQDWCMYVKGGSASLAIEANQLYDCGTGGFTAGQGTGMQFMTAPWLHYEAYDIKFTSNIVHDTEGAGMGVNGGYNILLAYNTLYRIGARDHLLEFVFGSRSCDGQPGDEGRERCASYLAAGGWGTTVVDDGTNYARIPNRHIYVYNNVIYNPTGYRSPQHLVVPGPYSGASQNGSNVPEPARADEDLQIRGNVIWNGAADTPLGIEDSAVGCGAGNAACNAAQLRADNAINTLEPQLVSPASGDFRPLAGGNLFSATTYIAPAFPSNDRPQPPLAPQGELVNNVAADYAGRPRSVGGPAGAYGVFVATSFVYLPLVR